MDNKKYVHVLVDPAVDEPDGQIICNHCKLEGTRFTDMWEEYLNGCWTLDTPSVPGYYQVVIQVKEQTFMTDIDYFDMTSWQEWPPYFIRFWWSKPLPLHDCPLS